MSSTLEVGRKLVDLCREGKNLQAVDTLYSPTIVSVEAFDDGTMPRQMEGIDAIREKNRWWLDNHEIHRMQIDGPYPHDDRFIVRMTIDATPKAGPMTGKRMTFEEAGLYTVKDGKIVREEYFYHMGG